MLLRYRPILPLDIKLQGFLYELQGFLQSFTRFSTEVQGFLWRIDTLVWPIRSQHLLQLGSKAVFATWKSHFYKEVSMCPINSKAFVLHDWPVFFKINRDWVAQHTGLWASCGAHGAMVMNVCGVRGSEHVYIATKWRSVMKLATKYAKNVLLW